MENMPGMGPPMSNATDHHMPGMSHDMAMSHMTFFWGKNAEILFSGWPGTSTGMYVLALIIIFTLALIVEWMSSCRWLCAEPAEKSGSSVASRVAKTLFYGTKVTLGYFVMLAVMSFNVGVLIVAVAGYALGFFFFRSSVSSNSIDSGHV